MEPFCAPNSPSFPAVYVSVVQAQTKADDRILRNLGSRVSMWLGTGDISRSRNSWPPIEHKRVRQSVRWRRSMQTLLHDSSALSKPSHSLQKSLANHRVAIPVALNFIASGEFTGMTCALATRSGSHAPNAWTAVHAST